ncbi:MAG: TOBE domain-containing protein, partial [Acidimicrobiales bacterium]
LPTRPHAFREGEEVMWSVPGEEVAVGGRGPFRGRVADVVDLGSRLEAVIELAGGVRLISRHSGVADVGPGSECLVTLPAVEVWSPAPVGAPVGV